MNLTTKAMGGPVVLSAEAIAALPEVPLSPSIPGVVHRVLWQGESSMAGVMTVAAGHNLGSHAHRLRHHHLWVLEGAVEILGEVAAAGSYVHVPAGVDHDLDARATDGGTFLYLYLGDAD